MKKSKIIPIALSLFLTVPALAGNTYAATTEKATIVNSALKNVSTDFNLNGGLYGSDEGKALTIQNGSAVITADGVDFENAVVNGDLIVQANNVNLKNVTVKGNLIVATSKKTTLNLDTVKADNAFLEGTSAITLNATGKSVIKKLTVNQETEIDSTKDTKINAKISIENRTKLTIKGYVLDLQTTKDSKVVLRKGTIDSINANSYGYFTLYYDTTVNSFNANGYYISISGAGTIKQYKK